MIFILVDILVNLFYFQMMHTIPPYSCKKEVAQNILIGFGLVDNRDIRTSTVGLECDVNGNSCY